MGADCRLSNHTQKRLGVWERNVLRKIYEVKKMGDRVCPLKEVMELCSESMCRHCTQNADAKMVRTFVKASQKQSGKGNGERMVER